MSRHRSISHLMTLAAELSWAVPQVVAHRLTRMAMAGASPSPRDRREFDLMTAEKSDAFNESWAAMTAHSLHVQQAMVTSLLCSFGSPPSAGPSCATATAMNWHDAAIGVLGHGMVPVHRRAVANAKRLARTKLR
ncbi:MAG: hypothetical protein Q7T97_13945 [Burkholderiaceae bacterium]|nr:hypothetical protein [Burkholderiaceae bacterium]